MPLMSLCVYLLVSYTTPLDSGEVNLLDYSRVGPCDVTLTPEEPCEREGGDIKCPYLFNVPPLTVHLPKQLRDLERIVEELQTLKDSVDELRRMCADCTVRQSGSECGRESETVNEGMNRNEDGDNWLNADSLKDYSQEHETNRVKLGNRSDGCDESAAEKMIPEEKNKGGAEGQSTTGEINEEKRGGGKQRVNINGTFHTQRAKEQDKWTANAGGNEKLVDLVIQSTDENRWGKTDDRENDMSGKENSRGDREAMMGNGEEDRITGDLKNLEKAEPRVGQDRAKEMEIKTRNIENVRSKGINISNFQDEHTDKRQQQQHVEERKKKMEKGIIVERDNEKLREASKKGEEEEKETEQEIKTKGEQLAQGAQTDGDGGFATSKDTARTKYASKGQTSLSISAEGPTHESADSNAAVNGSPAFSSLTPPFPGVHKSLTTTAAGLQIKTTDHSATFIDEPGLTATGWPTTAPVSAEAGPSQQGYTGVRSTSRPTPITSFHRVTRPTMTTTTQDLTVATSPGVSKHRNSTAKMNTSSNTKTGMKPLGAKNPKFKNAKIINSHKPAQGPLSDKKTRHDQKQKPPYHKPQTKPKQKGFRQFQGPKPNQGSGNLPADLNLKNTSTQKDVKENTTNQNPPNTQNPKPHPKLPMSHERNQPVNVNSPDKTLPTEHRPKFTQIPIITQRQKISNSEKKKIHFSPLKLERTLKTLASEEKPKLNQNPESNQGLRDVPGQTENAQTTHFTTQVFPKPDAELLENAGANLLPGTKNVSSAQKVTLTPIPIKLPYQSQTTNSTPDVNFEPGQTSNINQQEPEPGPRSKPNVKSKLQQTHTEEGLETPQQNQSPRLFSTPVSERNPGAESSNVPLSKQRSHTRPTDIPQAASAERSKSSTPLKPISKTDTDLDPLQMARAILGPVQTSQTNTPPLPGSAKSFTGVNIHPEETEVRSKTFSSSEGGAKPHLNALPEDVTPSPASRTISDPKPQTSGPTPSIQATTVPNRTTPGLLPGDFHESGPVSFNSEPKNDGESNHGRDDKQVQLSKPAKGSEALPTDQKAQIPEPTAEQLTIQNTKPLLKTTPAIQRPTGGLTSLLPEFVKTSRTDQNWNPELSTADGGRGETNLKPERWSVSTATQQPVSEDIHTPRIPPNPVHVTIPLTGIMDSVSSEAGSKPVISDPDPDSRRTFPHIKPKPEPAPKNGLNQSNSDLKADPETEHKHEPDETPHVTRGFKTPLLGLTTYPTLKTDGAPGAGYDKGPSPLPRHRSQSTPTAEPGATSAQRSTPSFPLKSVSKSKTELDPSHMTEETSGPIQNSQMTLPPSYGPVKLLDDITNSPGDTEVSTIKMTTLDPKSSSSQDGRTVSQLHTLPGDFTANPNSRVMPHQKPQTTAAPPPIHMTDRPNRIIPRILSSVTPSDSPTQPKQAANVDSKLHHNEEETTKRQIYDSPNVMNRVTSSSSPDLRSTNPAKSGPEPLAPDVSPDSARELRVKINQVAAFFNNSRRASGRHPERHSTEHPEDKQRGSRPDGINSKLLTRIPSKGKTCF